MKTILKKAKRTLSLLLVLLMVVPMTVSLAVPASAAEVKYAVEGGYITFDTVTQRITKSDPSVLRVIIPSHINGIKVLGIDNSVFRDTKIQHIELPEGFLYLGSYVFTNCYGLDSIVIPKSLVLSQKETPFYCSNIKTIYVRCSKSEWDSVTRNFDFRDIGHNAEVIYEYPCSINGHSMGSWQTQTAASCIYSGTEVRTCSGCSKTETRTLPANGVHSYSAWKIATDSTCTSGGTKMRSCIHCGDTQTETFPASGIHVYGEWNVTTPATCVDDGQKIKTCMNCGDTVSQSISATGVHSYGEWFVSIESSCLEKGQKSRICSVCSNTETSVVNETGHSFGEWTNVSSSTCVSEGEEKRTCVSCNVYETRNLPVNQNHSWGEWYESVAPTCTEKGKELRNCEKCGISEVRDTWPTGVHVYGEWVLQNEATCAKPGSNVRNCIMCGVSDYENIPVTNIHTYEDWKIESPTCINDGRKYRYCTVCSGIETLQEETLSAIGHQMGEWSVTMEPTCTDEGIEIKHCANCDKTEIQAIPTIEHNFGDWAVSVEPTCVAEGTELRTCANCDAIESQHIPSTGVHTYGEWIVTTAPGCAVEGEETRTCADCDAFETQSVPSTGNHTYGEWIVTTAPGCAVEGEETRTCADCDAFETQSVPATGDHTYGKWTVSVEPTVFENGEQIRQCENCDAIETEEIEKLDMVNPFTDVKDGQWYTEGILWCYHSGYMAGVSDTVFGRKDNVTRAMFATILAKIDGGDISGYNTMSFTDVKPGQWYSNAIEWAYQNGYAAGLAEGYFSRKDNVSREQIALFFYTYSSKNGIDVSEKANLSAYTDLGRVHSWALNAVEWAVAKGLISGTSETTLSPRDSATRAEIALIIKNYVENVKN